MLFRQLFLLFVVGCSLAGCGPADEVRSYKVPKPVEVPLPELTGEFQILGALFPDDNPAWFFKLGGKASDLAPHAADFEKLLATVRFPNGMKKQPVWDLPMGKGWENGEGRGDIVLATILPDPKNKSIEISLSSSGGGAFGNVKRWAKQLGQDGYTPGHFAKNSKPILAVNILGTWIDIRGPKAPPPPGSGPMMSKPHP